MSGRAQWHCQCQEDFGNGKGNPWSVQSGLEVVGAQEVGVIVCRVAHLAGQSLGLSTAFIITRGLVGRQGYLPLGNLGGMEPVDAHEGCVACASP